MSFNGNSQRRYGHVPPAQYGPSGAQDPNRPPQGLGLHRQSSFDNGDDAAFFDPNGNRYQNGPPPVPSRPVNMPQEEMFLNNPSQTPLSPGRSTFGTPALSGFQHQYQPFPAGPQSPPLPQVQYNPQHFARTQSTSQPNQYRPQPAYVTPPTPTAHQPYNPALYQNSQQLPLRQQSVAGYNPYAQTYSSTAMPQMPQSPSPWVQQPQQYGSPPVRLCRHARPCTVHHQFPLPRTP
jgi:hypothetical protein